MLLLLGMPSAPENATSPGMLCPPENAASQSMLIPLGMKQPPWQVALLHMLLSHMHAAKAKNSK